MEFEKLKENWERFGECDPLWAILTDSDKKWNKWDIGEFFQTGKAEMSVVLRNIEMLGFELERNRALDFGCGVGRLTQAMCGYWERCYGVDISLSMIELAKKHNKYRDRCEYITNNVDNLRLFQNNFFDFVYSAVVLQHMEPRYSKRYIREFIRILAPRGILVFQMLSEQKMTRNRNYMTEPLPENEFKAKTSLENAPRESKAGSLVPIKVKVRNESQVVWPAFGQNAMTNNYRICLGNHWLDGTEQMLVLDDVRGYLPEDLPAGEEVEIEMWVNAPRKPGSYILEVDMVQELVSWFKEQGATTARMIVDVVEDKDEARPLEQTLNGQEAVVRNRAEIERPPVMEMYSIAREEVMRLVEEVGGKVIDVREDNTIEGWKSFIYFVAKV